jgi:DNA-binding transcriptional LysR family regulator
MNIRTIDLNLLLCFEALLEEKTVTAAARRAGMTQPAMSNALGRLRRTFDDPLLVRSGRQMASTARARELAPPIVEALAKIRGALADASGFKPEDSTRCYTIATTDYGECVALPRIVARLQRSAPGASIRVQRVRHIFDVPDAELNECDFALGIFPQPLAVGSGIATAQLFSEKYVGVLRRRHPALRHGFGLRRFVSFKQMRVNYGKPSPGIIDEALSKLGLVRSVGLTIPHQATVLFIAAQSDLLGIVPERLAQTAARGLGLRVVPLPIKLPHLMMTLAWHQRHHADAAHRWFREFVVQGIRWTA